MLEEAKPTPQTPRHRLLASPDLDEVAKTKLRQEHARLDPFELKKTLNENSNTSSLSSIILIVSQPNPDGPTLRQHLIVSQLAR